MDKANYYQKQKDIEKTIRIIKAVSNGKEKSRAVVESGVKSMLTG